MCHMCNIHNYGETSHVCIDASTSVAMYKLQVVTYVTVNMYHLLHLCTSTIHVQVLYKYT